VPNAQDISRRRKTLSSKLVGIYKVKRVKSYP